MSQFRDQFPETSPDHAHYGFNVGLMTGMLELGAFIGCLFFPAVADRISRKWGLTVATFFFVVGATIQTAADNYDTIVAGRFIGGIDVGTLAMGAPLYISEISPPTWRGAFRLPFLLQMFPALVVGTGIHCFPFSPRWLAMRGRDEESLDCLSKLRRRSPQDEKVQLEWKGILLEVPLQQAILEREYPDHTRRPLFVGMKQWIDLFRPKYIKRTLVALAIAFFQQASAPSTSHCLFATSITD